MNNLLKILKEVTATDRYSKHGYVPEQVAGISDYFKRLNLIKLGRTSVNGRYEFYWVKSMNDKLPVVYYDENKIVHVDDNVVKDIISKIKPAFGSPETSGDREGYNPPYVAFGNAVMEWVAQELKIPDAQLDRRLTGTLPLSPFNPIAAHARSRTVPDNATRLNEAISTEAAQLHAMVSCGQDAAQDFFDENNIDAKALVTYIQRNKPTDPTLIYDVRDYISGAKGTVGGEKKLRDKFIKQFQIKAPIKEGVIIQKTKINTMKISQLEAIIKQEIRGIVNEAVNPELDKLVKNFVKGLATKYQYGEQDALYAIFESLKRQQMLAKDANFRPY